VVPALLAVITVAGCSSGSVAGPSTGAPVGAAGSTAGAQPAAGSAAGQAVPGSAGYTGGSLAPTIAGNSKPGTKGAFCKLLSAAQAATVLGAKPTSSRPHLYGDRPGGAVLDGCVFVAGSTMISYDVIELGSVPSNPAGAAGGVLPDGVPGTGFDPGLGDGSAGVQTRAPGGGTVNVVAIRGRREVVVTTSMKTAAAARTSAVAAAKILLGA
jgi:hypothetical protein